jgi:hypothetical protein
MTENYLEYSTTCYAFIAALALQWRAMQLGIGVGAQSETIVAQQLAEG